MQETVFTFQRLPFFPMIERLHPARSHIDLNPVLKHGQRLSLKVIIQQKGHLTGRFMDLDFVRLSADRFSASPPPRRIKRLRARLADPTAVDREQCRK